ncbi:putative membrane protein [Verrucomicrobium sp. GAS474]|uniref:DUF2238 domain-containing protein n=1 Tax=Verrucomicrobium sp. GAS474 TaxID=1882831 RepID=UPI00087C6124|nr:DUF2238 domain-containing protein [Verrucomicrobium sp. GAS474]SDT86073.1 putative membrane protein [Verrucomicrobium sp. GAS474]
MKTHALTPFLLLLLLIPLGVWSWTAPYDRLTWWLEVFPAIVGLLVLVWTFPTFPLTKLVYCLIALHMAVLLVGGHYTYAREPFFESLKETFGWQRNHYDRLGHFVQGFVPALIAREILIRRGVVRSVGWLYFLVVCICFSISAAYELIEWATALAEGTKADDFLGTQGDPWDTQEDMFCALVGANVSLVFLSGLHNRQLLAMAPPRRLS